MGTVMAWSFGPIPRLILLLCFCLFALSIFEAGRTGLEALRITQMFSTDDMAGF